MDHKKILEEPSMEYGKLYSYADYLKMEIEERIEIIKGKIFKMSPAPARIHQKVLGELNFILHQYFMDKSCELYIAPFDVRLIDPKKQSKKDEDIFTVFQPDLCVICDREKLDDRGCIGAPDLIVEILSPSNSNKEMNHKYTLYEENAVREYWIVDYNRKNIHQYILEGERYIGLKPRTEDEEISSHIFPDLSFHVSAIFED